MVVRVDNLVGAVHYVEGKTLLVALLEVEHFEGETDEVSAMFRDLRLSKEGSERTSSIDGDEGKEDPDEEINSSESESESEATQHKQGSPQTDKPSKIRILEIRAEAMAEEFASRICGPDFVMPEEFF